MPLLPTVRTTTTTQGETNSEESRVLSTETGRSTSTPGLETTQQIKPATSGRTVEEAVTQTSTTEESTGPKVTTQLERERTTTSTNLAHQVRTLNLPSSSANLSAEDEVMEIEFTLRIRDLLC